MLYCAPKPGQRMGKGAGVTERRLLQTGAWKHTGGHHTEPSEGLDCEASAALESASISSSSPTLTKNWRRVMGCAEVSASLLGWSRSA